MKKLQGGAIRDCGRNTKAGNLSEPVARNRHSRAISNLPCPILMWCLYREW